MDWNLSGKYSANPIISSYSSFGLNELKSTHPLLQSDVYFVHSYQAEMSEYVVAYADYGTKIPGVIQYRNYIGIQFHPEKVERMD